MIDIDHGLYCGKSLIVVDRHRKGVLNLDASPRFLFHYCSNRKCFSILSSKTFRMSDIQKSNDSQELRLFFPSLIRRIEQHYIDDPFPFQYKNMSNVSAMLVMTRESLDFWNKQFTNGGFTNYVACFSESPDVLSQWRGYADDGRGCCIGFSKEQLDEYCLSHPNVLSLEKVIYLAAEELDCHIDSAAKAALTSFSMQTEKALEDNIISNGNPEDDIKKHYHFDQILQKLFVASLRLKSKGFTEEGEWRMFLRNPIHKDPDLLYRDCISEITGSSCFIDTLRFLKNRVEYMETDDDLVSFIPISFSEFQNPVITQIWTGPKNHILDRDLESYLAQKGYNNISRFRSAIPYR